VKENMMINKLTITALLLAAASGALAQAPARVRALSFASDFQTVPAMANTPGFGGATFQTYVAILNPTAASFPVNVSLFDGAGVRHDATITLAAGEMQTYTNFLDTVFHATGGGAVTFQAPDSTGGTHNNRFIVTAEVRTTNGRYATPIPALEFAGSNSPSFAAGVNVDANTRTNVGCFNQSDAANRVRATVLDATGKQTLGTVDLLLVPNAWGQTSVNTIVSNGYIRFDPTEAAVCYAVVVDNATNDGRFISAAEYRP
jgi:hypothetical protein